jgi:hypothetical protein
MRGSGSSRRRGRGGGRRDPPLVPDSRRKKGEPEEHHGENRGNQWRRTLLTHFLKVIVIIVNTLAGHMSRITTVPVTRLSKEQWAQLADRRSTAFELAGQDATARISEKRSCRWGATSIILPFFSVSGFQVNLSFQHNRVWTIRIR